MKVVLENNIDKVKAELPEAIKKAFYVIGLTWQKKVTDLITKLDIVDTGRYRQSMDFVQPDDNKLVVGSEVDYAQFLELGTKSTKGRPALRRSIEENKKEYEQIFEDVLKGDI